MGIVVRAAERVGRQDDSKAQVNGAHDCRQDTDVGLASGDDERGHAALRRTYKFEFSDDGMRRRNGSLVMLGKELEFLYLEPYLVQ